MEKSKKFLVHTLIMFLISGITCAQENTIIPDLSKIVDEDGWQISNRKVNLLEENGNKQIYFDAQPGDGIAWLKDFEFNNGIIESDIKGKDIFQRSFVGIVFHVVDNETYDAVYFRPFNFISEDPFRIGHAVQYISHPTYTWQKLRNEYPEKYENAINPIPDPNSFFHVKIVVEKPKISVFVNNADEPCLVVDVLSGRTGGWLGLWVGNNSDGTFANLKITKKNK